MRALFVPIAAIALILPPVPAPAGMVILGSCGDIPPTVIDIPAKPGKPNDQHDCCNKGCHAASERKKKDRKNGCC